jgi:hypothetical protein
MKVDIDSSDIRSALMTESFGFDPGNSGEFSTDSGERALTTTCAPAPTKPETSPAPMPPVPPVITTIFPEISNIFTPESTQVPYLSRVEYCLCTL